MHKTKSAKLAREIRRALSSLRAQFEDKTHPSGPADFALKTFVKFKIGKGSVHQKEAPK